MTPLIRLGVIFLAATFCYAGSANAMTIFETGTFHGATGSVGITDDYVIWEIDLTNYDGDAGPPKDHSLLTDVGIKIGGITITGFDDSMGTPDDEGWNSSNYDFFVGGSIGGAGCSGGPDSGLSCLHITAPDLDALGGDMYSFYFDYTGDLVLGAEIAYRGKFGPDNGWVISESGSVIPEPSAALVFGVGVLILRRSALRR